MDTLKAFNKAEVARASGATFNYFDGVKIKEIMEKHQVKEASIYLSQDRGWTETTIKLDEKGKLVAESIGVDGSIWATPMLNINDELFEVGTKDQKRMTIKFT